MRTFKMLMMVALTILSVSVFAQDTTKSIKPKSAKITYRCSMHPEVTSTKPGNCYKCGAALNLSPKEKNKWEQMNVYNCPLHPEETSDKPAKCSKCGMDMKKMEMKAQVYACPMHPEETSDKPGKCPKCGMSMKRKEVK